VCGWGEGLLHRPPRLSDPFYVCPAHIEPIARLLDWSQQHAKGEEWFPPAANAANLAKTPAAGARESPAAARGMWKEDSTIGYGGFSHVWGGH